jgi:hypothetical protein
VPAHLQEKLTEALLLNTRRKLQIKSQAIKLSRVLNGIGISPLFLKGTALLLEDDDTPVGFRKQVDIDVLIEQDDLQAACDALCQDGYAFYDLTGKEPVTFSDTRRALALGAHHHHLPPLAKPGYDATVEIHKHPLRRRFQSALPLQAIYQSARTCQSHGASYRVSSPSFQLMQLVLGEFIHDGYAARFEFPVRAGHDYMAILDKNRADFTEIGLSPLGNPYQKKLQLFEQLATELMASPAQMRLFQPVPIKKRVQIMEKRYESTTLATALDMQARWRYLGLSLWHDRGKLPGYLKRQFIGRGRSSLPAIQD